ncbi:MAG: permease [Thermodesulfobacteriota bacterium]|nr:permease [Thermodesulfobacteriota bacterium]
MKKISDIPFGYIVALIFALTSFVLIVLEIPFGKQLVREFTAFSSEMVIILPCIFILIGLLDVWIPKQLIQQHIGEESGFRGAVYVIMLAMFQGGPLYGAFPTVHLLWKKGCSMRNVFMYLGAFSSLKIPMMLFEVNFLGWKFTLARAAIALPVFVIIAYIMARYARVKGLQMKNLTYKETKGQQ